ncbi:MAG: FAD-binding protein [Candidatus Rokubacteria bacterium]|nr:FAD-binding protein [Candidatus Rokubacteria bacterium]
MADKAPEKWMKKSPEVQPMETLVMKRAKEKRPWSGLSRRQFLMAASGIATTPLGMKKGTGDVAPRNRDAAASRGIQCQPGIEWKNWSQNVDSTPECAFHPETRDDLIQVVNQARAAGKKIRVAGDGHSFSPLVPTDEFMVFISNLKNVTVDTSDPNQPVLRFSLTEAHVTVRP